MLSRPLTRQAWRSRFSTRSREGGAPLPDTQREHLPRLVAPGHGICVCLVRAPPPRAVPLDTWALLLICQCPVYVARGTPVAAPQPVQICVKWGDRYTLVDTAWFDLGDHRATLTLPGCTPLVIVTPMVANATYDKARGGLVLVPSGPGAQHLRDADSKGCSASWISYVRALQPVRPVGFKVVGARAQARRDWIVPRSASSGRQRFLP